MCASVGFACGRAALCASAFKTEVPVGLHKRAYWTSVELFIPLQRHAAAAKRAQQSVQQVCGRPAVAGVYRDVASAALESAAVHLDRIVIYAESAAQSPQCLDAAERVGAVQRVADDAPATCGKCDEKGVKIYDSVLNYIAENIKTNVRDLEGSLTTLIAYSNLIKSRITLEIAQEQLKNIISTPMAGEQDISIGSIVKEVASYFNVEIGDIKGKKRTAIIKDARNMAIYLTRRITQYSTTEIGTYFDRDHSTITHSIDKVETEKKTNSELASTLDSLEMRIRSRSK